MRTADQESVYYQSVREYHERNGHRIGDVRTFPSAGVKLQRARLILEEIGETVSAYHDGNLIEFADGLGDLLYVIVGTAVAFGSTLKRSEMEFFEHMNAPDGVPKLPDHGVALHNIERLVDASNLLMRAMIYDRTNSIHDELKNLIRATFAFAHNANIPLDKVFHEVHRSNMTKSLVKTDGVAKYGASVASIKGPSYEPPRIKEILGIADAAGVGGTSV